MSETAPAARLALLTNIPAPYRIAVFNNLARLTNGGFAACFIASSSPRRTWAVAVEQMNFDWQFLCDSSDERFLTGKKAAGRMLGFLTRVSPRTVICGSYDTLAAWVAFAWCKLFRRRFVLWVESNARDQRRPGKIRNWLKRLIVSKADAVAASGKATVQYLKLLGARSERIFLSPNAVDNEFFAREARKVNVAKEKKLHGYPPRLILYSGRLVREKGTFVLMEAFRTISSEVAGVGLLIVGHGPEQKALEDLCQSLGLERVYFVGAQPYDRLPYFYALADVLILPTFSDTWGLVVNEAFATGLPVIASTAAGSCDDLIAEGQTGFTVKPGDAGHLARKIMRLLRDEPLRARMSANCRRLIEKYSVEACARGLLAAALGETDRVPLGLVVEAQPEQTTS